jgi:ketosteroid isomerase-like protein
MNAFSLMVLLALTNWFAGSAFAQDDLIVVKEKNGVTKIKDKTKPLRREFEAIYAEGVQNLKNNNVEAMLAKISPDFIALLPDGQTVNYDAMKSYIQRGAEQFVEISDLRITLESLTAKGDEVIVEARQYFSRKQRLRDGKIHEVFSSVLQSETWVKTADGWKKKKVENLREQALTVDGVPHDPHKPYDSQAPPDVPNKKP